MEATIPLYKVVVAGNGNVGKTSLIRRYCEGKFDSSRVATLGVDFQTHTVELPGGVVKLSIWDMAGQDHFKVVREGFYRGCRAVALVYDVTDHKSLVDLARWRDEVLAAVKLQQFIIVGNKIDLERAVPSQEGRDFAASIGAGYIETSAQSGNGVEAMFSILAGLAVGR